MQYRLFFGALLVSALAGCGGNSGDSKELLNVSYDPTRELWKELNEKFIEHHKKETGEEISIQQSHGGSGSQARAVIDGLKADVVTLAMWTDIEAIRKKGYIADDWQDRLPNKSLPYHSTIVFVVRKGNPKNIKDWKDLARSGVEVITPNPKTSGNGKLSFLAAWAAIDHEGRKNNKEQEARDREALEFVTDLYRNVSKLDTAARAATQTFAQQKIGDVHLTWENEAYLELEEFDGQLEIVYPSVSIKAEPFVSLVDRVVDKKGTRALAEEYLKFVYTDEAQDILAKHHYRPSNAKILDKHAKSFPKLELVEVTKIAKDWDDASKKFFAEGAIFDDILERVNKN